MQKNYNAKRKLNRLKTSLLLLMMVCFAGAAQAQTNVYMHSGTQNVSSTGYLDFYDSGGPESPDGSYFWEKQYKPNENSTLTFKDGSNKIQMTFKTFQGWNDSGWPDYILRNLGDDWSARLNDDYLYIYDGETADETKLLVTLTGNIKKEFTITANGPITVKFVSNGQYNGEGWHAEVRSVASTNTVINQPIVSKSECGDVVEIFNPNLGGTVYYTTNGNDPLVVDPLQGTEEYQGAFDIDLDAANASVTVKAIVYYGPGSQSVVTTLALTHADQRPTPGEPTVSLNGNMITMKPAVNPGLDETYNVIYTTDGTLPTVNNYAAKITAPWDAFEWHTPNTTFIVATIAEKANCESLVSDTVKLVFGNVTVPTPDIDFPSGNATITCSMDGAAIYYTKDGSDPVFSINESTHVVTVTNGTLYSAPFAVTMGTTVKAKAIYMGNGNVIVEGYEPSQVASEIYVPEGGSGTDGSVVLLDDREDHTWSYYSDTTQPIHSFKPADVKITYKGFGANTMTSTSTANMPANSAFDTDVEEDQVAVNVGETENQFIYLKTLENANADGTGNYPYTMIANPFQVRPTYEESGGGNSFSYSQNFETNNDWTFVQGTTNYWTRGTAAHSGGNYGLYITNGSTNANYSYNNYTTRTAAVSYAYKEFSFEAGTYTISYDWRAFGEVSSYGSTVYDYLRVVLAPASATLTANSLNDNLSNNSVPSGWTALDAGALYNSSSWGSNNREFSITTAGSYKVIFVWRNDNSSGTQPPAAIDNISIIQGSATNTAKYRGFYAWRVKSLSSGLAIQADGVNVGVDGIIYPDQEIEFVTANAKGNEVEFEALWAQAYVTTGTSSMSSYASNSGNYKNAYERNFHVLTNSTSASNLQKSYPLTISSSYPDGTSAGGSLTGGFTAAADTKIENIAISNATNSTWSGAAHNFVFGRGVTGTINEINGMTYNTSSSANFNFRIESGTFNTIRFLGQRVTYTGKVTAVLGSDYDRANNDNSKLEVNTEVVLADAYKDYYLYPSTLGSQNSVGTEGLHCTVKSGDYDWGNYAGNYQFYISAPSSSVYVKRSLVVEGGVFADIAGGIETNDYIESIGDHEMVNMRFKGGHIKGALFGAAQYSGSGGHRRMVITGGIFDAWIAGGCNGTGTTGGELYGDAKIYFGGDAQVGNENGGTHAGGHVSYTENYQTTYGINGADGGIIFGAGCGINPTNANYEPNGNYQTNTVGRVNNSTVVVADQAIVWRELYGGGNFGYVRANGTTNVHILGGTVKGNVYGGANSQQAQTVNITMTNGNVDGNIYGGSNTWGTTNNMATINVSGGTVTNVFGGGLGSSTSMAAGTAVNVSGGTINNNVYGGGEQGSVTGNTNVVVSGGTMHNVYGAGLGTEYTGNTWPASAGNANITGTTTVTVSGGTIANVYGGGENGSVAFNSSATSSTGKSTVNVSGGNISENVFGGGENGTTQGPTIVNVSGGTIRGNVFGGALGAHGRIYVNGMRTVNMTGGHVYANVYGGSRNANDGNSLSRTDAQFNSYTGDEKICVTNISGGVIDQNVYAAGYYGSTFGSVYAFIGKDAIENAPYKEPTTGVTYSVTQLNIGGTVWAGGDWGTFNGEFGNSTVSGNSNIYVDGEGYETETQQASNAQYMNIGGSVLGCGTSCHAGKKDRTIVIRNYGHADGTEPEQATRTLFSIQFAKTLIFDNANVNFTGQGRINSLITTEKFGIYEISAGNVTETASYGVRLLNGSGLFLNAPVTQIANFKSMQLKSNYADLYAALNDGGMTDAADFDVVTPTTLPTVKNKVRVNHGIYVEVKYGSQYGPLIGYAYMMASEVSDDDATCAYARPRWETNASFDINDTDYDNRNDGGWVSYDSDKNTFALDGTNPTDNGVQMPYENHTVVRNGEGYFRIWRVGGKEHYREGVFDAAANGTETFSTVDVTITLPAFRAKTNYYRFETVGDGTNTSIDYGADVLTFNAANYAKPCEDGNWMYYDEDNSAQVTGVNENSTATAFKKALADIKAQPDVNFGLVAMPGNGLAGSNYIICQDADNNLAAATTKYIDDDDTKQPQVTFRLTYYNTLSANMTWDPMTIVLVQCDANGTPVDRVTISLAVNTSASIEQVFTTQLYAVMNGSGQGGTAATYNAKVVLPLFNVYEAGEPATFTLNSVNFEPKNSGELIARGGNYTDTDFAVDYAASLNYDNTLGWDSNTGTHDTYPMTQSGATAQEIGTAGGRSEFAIDFTLHYNAMNSLTQTDTLGILTYNITFNNYKNAQGQLVNNQPLTAKVYVIRRGQGSKFYLDGVNGSNSNKGKYPNDAVKQLSTIFNRCGFIAGDKVYVVNKVTANNALTWNGLQFDNVTLYRYNGGHELKNGAGPIVGNANNDAYLGELLVANNKVTVTGITMDGYYNPAKGETPETSVQATAPLVTINNGGTVELTTGTLLNKNYNSSNAGAVMVNEGGTLMMNKNAQIKDNVAAEGAGVYMSGTMIVSDTIKIVDNKKGTVQNNVYLNGDDMVITLGTPASNDEFGALGDEAEIGVTKAMSTTDTYTKVVYAEDNVAWLETPYNSNPNAIIYHDGGKYQLVKYTDNHYLYWVGTWVTLQDWNPKYESATAEGYDANNFDLSDIDTPEELAWFISYVNGLNGATAHRNAVANITGDIDMSESIWVPIGTNTNTFTGTFEGNGHVITGLRSSLVQTNMGMFGNISGTAQIKNVIADVNFNANAGNMASLVGTMNGGTLSNVEAAGTLTGGANTENMGGLVGVNDGGTIHSSFAVNTMTGGTNTVMGGLVGINHNDLYNSYANTTMSGSTKMGGLVGVNSGTVENCYVVLGTQNLPAFAYQNQVTVGEGESAVTIKGNINYCYADKAGTQVGDAQSPGTVTKSGTYSDVQSDIKHINYMYRDNLVTAPVENTYANHEDHEYLNNHTVVWNGLLSVLNQWVAGHSGYTPWFRPINNKVNGDLPVLAFPKDNSMATTATDGKYLQYAAYDLTEGQSFNNGIDGLLANTNYANIFLYGNATEVANVPAENVKVTINEDAVLLQAANPAEFTATVGVTFDNSDHGQNAYDYYGNQLLYDWHFMSTPLANAPIGATYEGETGNGKPVDIKTLAGSYFPNGLITEDNPAVGGKVKWDFYTYFEPEYHWINLKRSGANHWHTDGGAQINYVSGQNGLGEKQNETIFVPGKGYMMAISQDSYLSNTGTLNNGDVEIMLTNQEPLTDTYNKGWNLVGNPYQAYLDLNMVGAGTYYIYDAERGVYVPYAVDASENPVTPSRYIHPHQGFFMYSASDNNQFSFTQSMATTKKENGSYFRGDEQINYPLVNLFARSQAGNNDLAIIELNRPEIGGATKMSFMTNANFELSAYLDGQDYGLLFTPEGTEKVPVHFTTQEDGTYTLTWDTQNGVFTSLLLVDNMTGVITDMLRSDHYTFEASADDYASRFYLTYACTGVEEVNEGDGSFAFFDGSEWVVNGKGQLDIIDVTGRVLFSKRIANEQNRVNLNNVAPGVYMMRVSDGKDTMVQKIVVR